MSGVYTGAVSGNAPERACFSAKFLKGPVLMVLFFVLVLRNSVASSASGEVYISIFALVDHENVRLKKTLTAQNMISSLIIEIATPLSSEYHGTSAQLF